MTTFITNGAANCFKGYYGEYCGKQCSFPKFGYGCQQTCLCTKSRCHFSTGCDFKQNALRNQIVKQEGPTMTTTIQQHQEMKTVLEDHSFQSNFTTSQRIGDQNERQPKASKDELSSSLFAI
uniref:Uncharacterized protein LOC111099602 isoform X2 n=1 Tax=Crassostrea virginica TaxID=6565 RepID=A0A8B8A5A4_CRAVI|nr:uncharacterized protein LOC111099602 isoform X2 [Crassostrea virginica]